MRIRTRLFASFREAVGQSEVTMDVPDGSAVAQIVDRLRQEYPRLGAGLDNAMLAVNHEYVSSERLLEDGDELALIPPVSGGWG